MSSSLTRLVAGQGVEETHALLEWARTSGGISAQELAKRMGVIPQTVQEYREGRRQKVGWVFMVRWLKACGFRVVVERAD